MIPEDSLLSRQLDEYQIEALLGRGGMARVYRAFDIRLKRRVAIKVIDTPYRAEAGYVTRFEREAQVIAQLSHPQVVQLYRYGEADGFLYMVMQYIDGADLHSILHSYRQDGEFMQPDEILPVVRDICEALDYIHNHGVVHRDIKPSNIMLTRQGRAVLTDFGLALLTDVGTLGHVFGSPQYIAPEQAVSSANASPASDLYSLGVILYEIYTGRLPFLADDAVELAMQHITAAPPSPRQIRPEISPEVEGVILRLLAKDPQARYSSGSAVVRALEQALGGRPGATEPLPTIGRLTMPERVDLHTPALSEAKVQPEAIEQPEAKVQPEANVQPEASEQPEAKAQAGVQPEVHNRPAPPTVGEGDAPGARPSGPHTASSPNLRRSLPWIGAGAGCLALLVLACLVVFSTARLLGIFLPDQRLTAPTAQPREEQVIPSPTDLPRPAVETPPPTNTPQNTPEVATPTATPPAGLGLLLAKLGKDAPTLVLVNQGRESFLLGGLQLGNTPSKVFGQDWEVERLEVGQCVVVQRKGKKKPRLDDIDCEPVGKTLEREGKATFWMSPFNVYYNGQYIGSCEQDENECRVEIPSELIQGSK